MDDTTVKSHSDAQLEGHEVTHKPDLKQTNRPSLVKSLTGSLRIFKDPQRPAKDPQG